MVMVVRKRPRFQEPRTKTSQIGKDRHRPNVRSIQDSDELEWDFVLQTWNVTHS